jgi:hypothetical protein
MTGFPKSGLHSAVSERPGFVITRDFHEMPARNVSICRDAASTPADRNVTLKMEA